MAKAKKTSLKEKSRAVPKPSYPQHLGCSPEEWRGKKRQEFRELRHALDRYEFGSAYTPDWDALYQLRRLVAQIEESLDAPDWVCW